MREDGTDQQALFPDTVYPSRLPITSTTFEDITSEIMNSDTVSDATSYVSSDNFSSDTALSCGTIMAIRVAGVMGVSELICLCLGGLKDTILTMKHQESGECRVKFLKTTGTPGNVSDKQPMSGQPRAIRNSGL